MEESHNIEDPGVSVREFLSEALEVHAEHQILWELGSNGEKAVKSVAKEFIDGQTQLFPQQFSQAEQWLERKEDLLRSPWLRYGIELELAYRALRRVHTAGERYLELDYRSLSRPLSDKATQYVAEVVATFAFGFEPASMALCRACLGTDFQGHPSSSECLYPPIPRSEQVRCQLVRRRNQEKALVKQPRNTGRRANSGKG